MNTLAAALATLPTPTTTSTATKAAAPSVVLPDGLTTVEQRVYAFAASHSAASPEARWAWRRLHAQIALGKTAWAVDAATWLHGVLPGNATTSVPAFVREAEAQSAHLYAQYAAEMRAQRLEALAQRVAVALERVAHAMTPVEAPVAPAPQLDATTAARFEARFEALEAANAANAEILAAIAAKVGVTP